MTDYTPNRGPVESKPFGILRRPICWTNGHEWIKVKRFDPARMGPEPAWFCERCGKSVWRPSGEFI